ncbi:HNH endonuclease signature motif containing protein [Arthrobacter sp. QXT-31]|uniref:HNH endonuclease signature motif containing protein n=1 Tax=Arthrobacter sp. QXT-31 TaxID=1357915 RepID=UPI00097178D8|nr:HNH endonuclease signature motif containing protein [Arthrobacter sp. QXT-31]APX04087.1 endonuclease [Arthrobacter sp. QXT-31]
MDNSVAAAEVLEALGASALALAAELRGAADPGAAGGDFQPDPVDPLGEQATACLDGLRVVGGMEARLAAVKVELAAGYVTADAAMAVPVGSPQDAAVRQMAVRAEVAGALTISEGAAERLLVESDMLTRERPMTLAALQLGRISWQHARIMCDETEGLSPEAAAAFEAHFLDPDAPNAARGCFAGELAPGRFRAKARYWRERHHPDSIETRHSRSVKDRRLEYSPDRDGMAWISAFLPADQAAGIWNRTTAIARGLQGPTEIRTLTQLRADVFSTSLLRPAPGITGGAAGAGQGGSFPGGSAPAGEMTAGEVPSPQAQVLVTVPVFSLLGHTDEPATLDGYGPIPASMARRLVANGATSFFRVLTDPRDGAPLEIGRTSYRLTKPMRQWLRLRDAKCTFPNCTNHSLDNDADHILAWADGGGTGVTNLGQPCPKHHRLKHATAWRPVGATLESPPGWISPSGRHYPAEHQDWEPPTWPDNFAPGNFAPDNFAPDNFQPGWSDASPSQDCPELPPGRALPEPPDWFGAPSGHAEPEPSDWPDPPDQPHDPQDFDEIDERDDPEPPLPLDPWPNWSSVTAA